MANVVVPDNPTSNEDKQKWQGREEETSSYGVSIKSLLIQQTHEFFLAIGSWNCAMTLTLPVLVNLLERYS